MEVTSYLLGKKSGGGGSEPTGTINITSNGTHNVKSYATASVNVQPDLETKSITITENTTTTITPTSGKDGMSSVEVVTNVSGGNEYSIYAGDNSVVGGYVKAIENAPSFTINGTSCEYMFVNYPGKTIPPLLGTENVTTMRYMFYKAPSVTNYNLSNYNTSNVTNMEGMFYNSSAVSIRNLDCSSFDIGKVTNTKDMFRGLYQLAVLDISSFDFSGVTTFDRMFMSCGTNSLQSDGAYADGIPYVYVKDATAQNWVLTADNGHPNTWSTNNVIIKTN